MLLANNQTVTMAFHFEEKKIPHWSRVLMYLPNFNTWDASALVPMKALPSYKSFETQKGLITE